MSATLLKWFILGWKEDQKNMMSFPISAHFPISKVAIDEIIRWWNIRASCDTFHTRCSTAPCKSRAQSDLPWRCSSSRSPRWCRCMSDLRKFIIATWHDLIKVINYPGLGSPKSIRSCRRAFRRQAFSVLCWCD